MSEQSTIDRRMYAYDETRETTWGREQSICPECHEEGLYIGTENVIEPTLLQDDFTVIGWQPMYACDDCHLIFGGPEYRD